MEDILEEAYDRLRELLEDDDAQVRLKAIELCLKYLVGKNIPQVVDEVEKDEGSGVN